MANPLEHAEHISHAGHEGGHGDDHAAHSKLGTYIGITMAVLGVILAYCAAKVGAERTELIQALVEQQHAHAKYQAQDIKHRVAVSNLRQLHAVIPEAELAARLEADLQKIDAAATPAPAPAKPEAAPAAAKPEAKPEAARADAAGIAATTAAARALGRTLTADVTPNKKDAALLAGTVERYLAEAKAANEWVESFDPAIKAHMEAQERYELSQLLAEIGIVVASVALLIKKRIPWFAALVLGVIALGNMGKTLAGTGHEVHEAEAKIEHFGKEYRELRTAHKASEADDTLVAEVKAWAGVPASAPAAPHHGGAPAHGGAHPAPAPHHE